MTGTPPRFVDCRCGHAHSQHFDHELHPQCVGVGCGCLRYQPGVAAASGTKTTVPPVPIRTTGVAMSGGGGGAAVSAPEIDDPRMAKAAKLITLGQASDTKRIVALANKAAAALEELRTLLVADAANATRRARIAELEAQLAAERAALSGSKQPVRAGTGGAKKLDEPITCCGKTFDTAQGIAVHRNRIHGSSGVAS